MSDFEKKLELINQGKLADLASRHYSNLIEEIKKKKWTELANHYRQGHVEQVTLVSGIAGICALEDLDQEIKRRILKAEKASHDMHKGEIE